MFPDRTFTQISRSVNNPNSSIDDTVPSDLKILCTYEKTSKLTYIVKLNIFDICIVGPFLKFAAFGVNQINGLLDGSNAIEDILFDFVDDIRVVVGQVET